MVIKSAPREYQKSIFETAKANNSLVVLPTGLGKTLIALLLSVHRLQKFPSSKVLLLAPTKPLVEQHASSFRRELPELFADVQVLTGELNAKSRAEIFRTADIIIATPQSIANDLASHLYSLDEVSLLIIDEAHRCLKNYDYTKIVQRYKVSSAHQRILGLTASPGSSIENVREICHHLDIEAIEIRTRDSEDVKDYLQQREYEKLEVPFPKDFSELRYLLMRIYDSKVFQLKERSLLFGPANKVTLLKLQNNLAKRAMRKDGNAMYGMSLTAQALKISHALELLETQTLSGLKEYMLSLQKQAEEKSTRAAQMLAAMPEFSASLTAINDLIDSGREHPKIKVMKDIVDEALKAKPSAKIIIFAQFRESGSQIRRNLASVPGARPYVFIGQAKKKETGMTQKEQKAIIEKFRSGEANVLCATSIGEEGLDIPEVDLVIFYEPIPSAIRKIQRAGRTARLMPGKIILLVTKDTRDEVHHYASSAKEKRMHSIIDAVKKEISNKQPSLDKF